MTDQEVAAAQAAFVGKWKWQFYGFLMEALSRQKGSPAEKGMWSGMILDQIDNKLESIYQEFHRQKKAAVEQAKNGANGHNGNGHPPANRINGTNGSSSALPVANGNGTRK